VNIKDLQQTQVQDFILQHEAEDENKLLLKQTYILGVPTSSVVDQIIGRRKAKLKLPTWYATKNIIYPPSVNIEQCSSEITAKFKVELLKQNVKSDFDKAVDLTGGFGVDSFFLRSIFKEVNYVEPDENLFEITRHNHITFQESTIQNPASSLLLTTSNSQLPTSNIHHHNSTAEQFLSTTSHRFDLIYIDPSRRTKGNQKIFLFADCQPDLISLLPGIFELTNYLLVKASPLIDLQLGINELPFVERIFVVAVENECKEVLFLCHKDFKGESRVSAVNFKSSIDSITIDFFELTLTEEKNAVVLYSNPLTYLYEPNVAILKSGAFKLIGSRYHLKKLQQNTHLYTSDFLVQNFPGRVFKIDALIKPDPKLVRMHFPEGKANVATRNYPLSPEELKKKTGLKDGGEKFLIGFSGVKEKFVAVCNKVIK
jgi:hypothetical protein